MNSSTASHWKGLILAIVGVAVLTAFAAVTPVTMRKLVLYSFAYGLCCGAIIVWTAREFGMPRRWAATLSIPLISCGLVLIAMQGYVDLYTEMSTAADDNADQAMARQILEAAAEQDPTLKASLDAHDRTRNPFFTDYLAHRVRPLGEWQQPWPTLFWGGEILFAAAAGAFLVWRQMRTPPTPVEPST